MFEIGQYIVYGNIGICEIVDIKKLDMQEEIADQLYYIMKPVHDAGSQVFTPIDNEKIIMRKILSKEEAKMLISEIQTLKIEDIANDKLREQDYKEALHSCDAKEWARIIKVLYKRRQERMEQGKKFSATDERYLKLVEGRFLTELELALNLSRENVIELL